MEHPPQRDVGSPELVVRAEGGAMVGEVGSLCRERTAVVSRMDGSSLEWAR